MKKILPYIPMVIVITFLFYIFINNYSSNTKNPRDMNGKIFLNTDDSIYSLKFEIDSVYEREHEPEDQRP